MIIIMELESELLGLLLRETRELSKLHAFSAHKLF